VASERRDRLPDTGVLEASLYCPEAFADPLQPRVNPSQRDHTVHLDKFADHEKTAYINESAILEAVSACYADRVFGPHRRDLFAADLATLDTRAARQRETERERHQRTLADLACRQYNLLRQADDRDPNVPFTQGLRRT
jgi:hypothetical protein